MGVLNDFPLRDFGCNVYFETGTGQGYSLTYALGGGFKRLYSVEIDRQTYEIWPLLLKLRLRLRGAQQHRRHAPEL